MNRHKQVFATAIGAAAPRAIEVQGGSDLVPEISVEQGPQHTAAACRTSETNGLPLSEHATVIRVSTDRPTTIERPEKVVGRHPSVDLASLSLEASVWGDGDNVSRTDSQGAKALSSDDLASRLEAMGYRVQLGPQNEHDHVDLLVCPPVQDDSLNLMWDQRSRYNAVAEAIRANTDGPVKILDVGSGEPRLSRRLLPDCEIWCLDPLLNQNTGDPAGSKIIRGTLQTAGIKQGEFDWLICVDTLEHVPAAERPGFLNELCRLPKQGVVLAGPLLGSGAAEADAFIDRLYAARRGRSYPWLDEHFRYGLPDPSDIEHHLKAGGLRFTKFANGYLPWHKKLLSATLLLIESSAGRQVVRELNREFTETCGPFDFAEPAYRDVYVARRDGQPVLPACASPDPMDVAKSEDAFFERVATVLDTTMTGIDARDRQRQNEMRRAAALEIDLDAARGTSQEMAARAEALREQLDASRAQAREAGQRAAARWEEYKELEAAWKARFQQRTESDERLIARIKREGDQRLETMSKGLAEAIANARAAEQRAQARWEEYKRLDASWRNRFESRIEIDARVIAEIRNALETTRAEASVSARMVDSLRERLAAARADAKDAARRAGDRWDDYKQLDAGWKARFAFRTEHDAKVIARSKHEAVRLGHELAEIRAGRAYRFANFLSLQKSRAGRIVRLPRVAITRGVEVFGKAAKRVLPLPRSVERHAEAAYFTLFRPLLKYTPAYSVYLQARRPISARAIDAQALAAGGPASAITQSWAVPSTSLQPGDQSVQASSATKPPAVSAGELVALMPSVAESACINAEMIDSIDRDQPAVIVFGIIDWHFRHQRPQHLAESLARRGHRVFYVSPRFVAQPNVGYDAEVIELEARDGGEAASIWHARFRVAGAPLIYHGLPSPKQQAQMVANLRKMLLDHGIQRAICKIDHPGWVWLAKHVPDASIVYDCMDHHAGFADTGEAVIELENHLLEISDLTLVSSEFLHNAVGTSSRAVAMVRNACDPAHFSVRPASLPLEDETRPVIGYLGAVAQWFDTELLCKAAKRFPSALFLVVGGDSVQAAALCTKHKNIRFVGEKPYEQVAGYVHAMDVCTIPFVVTDLIKATNPVKVYEYLAAGKPVVTTDLPELREPELDKRIFRAEDHDSYLAQLEAALQDASAADPEAIEDRISFAKSQSWAHRAATLDAAIERIEDPLVSIVIVTWNNLELTQACIESVFADTGYTNIEVIVVDNASSDDTVAYLEYVAASEPRLRTLAQSENLGFAAGNNVGIGEASGEYICLLNNDTIVTRGWLRTLVNHARRDTSIGLIGPITNNIGNEARIETSYKSTEDMHVQAFIATRAHTNTVLDLESAAFFCVVGRAEIWKEIGPLDEAYKRGYFEDDDYCQRVRSRGYRIVCADDAFVHHHLAASFGSLGKDQRDELLRTNQKIFEAKWGPWRPHKYRDPDRHPPITIESAMKRLG